MRKMTVSCLVLMGLLAGCKDGMMSGKGSNEPTAVLVPYKAWMTKDAIARKDRWTGRPLSMLGYRHRRLPNMEEPWVFMSEPTSCPKVAGGPWVNGDPAYWLYLQDNIASKFIDRSNWGTITLTGRTLRTMYPDPVGRCDDSFNSRVDWVEVEFKAVAESDDYMGD